MPSLGLSPDVISYSAVFGVCEETRQWEQTLKLCEQMQHQSVQLDGFGYLVHACDSSFISKEVKVEVFVRGSKTTPRIQCRHWRLLACREVGLGLAYARAERVERLPGVPDWFRPRGGHASKDVKSPARPP